MHNGMLIQPHTRKKKIISFATAINEPRGHYVIWNEPGSEIHKTWSHSCGISMVELYSLGRGRRLKTTFGLQIMTACCRTHWYGIAFVSIQLNLSQATAKAIRKFPRDRYWSGTHLLSNSTVERKTSLEVGRSITTRFSDLQIAYGLQETIIPQTTGE